MRNPQRSALRHTLSRLIRFGVVVYLLTLAGVVACNWVYQPLDPATAEKGDVIVVLASGLHEDGRLGAFTEFRTLSGIALYKAGLADRMHVTGGFARDYRLKTIGGAMRDYAIAEGVPPTAITAEEASYSTLQNALFSVPYIEDAAHIILVTNRFHLLRSWFSFRAFTDARITLSAPDYALYTPEISTFDNIRAHLREPLAVWFNIARFGVWWAAGQLGWDGPLHDAMLA